MFLEVLPAVCDLPLGFIFPTHPTRSGGDCDCCLQPHKSKDTPRKQTEMLHAELWSLYATTLLVQIIPVPSALLYRVCNFRLHLG